MKRILFETFQNYNDAVMYDNHWGDFIQKCMSIPAGSSFEKGCEIVGIKPEFFNKIIDLSIDEWREATSRSILHGISHMILKNTPVSNTPIFPDLIWQTRFLIMSKKVSPVFKFGLIPVFGKDKKPIIVKGQQAVTGRADITVATNKILRCLYLYWYMNTNTKLKLPKKLYRGIRAHDLYNHPTLSTAIAAIFAADKSREMKRKDAVDLLIKWICDKKLHEILDGNILSFTASIPVAKYFANRQGFILMVDSSKVEVITSEVHDERLQGKDYMSNKNEREYIVRLSKDYKFEPSDIIMSDLEYFIAEQNPLCVSLFDHDNKEAFYTMNGKEICALFRWRTNDSGGLYFNGDTRNDFKAMFGFDPLPTPANLPSITNFVVREKKSMW